MKSRKQPTLEIFLYVAALLVAILVRLANLGAAPLSEGEAGWALQALSIARSWPVPDVAMGPVPGYVAPTAVLFAIFGSTNFLARFLPAIVGSLLVLLPLVLQPWLVDRSSFPHTTIRIACVIFAFSLAIDPGLVASSRLAGGPMLALSTVLFTLAFWLRGRLLMAAILAGLALLSGPHLFTGLLGISIAWALWQLTNRQVQPRFNIPARPNPPIPPPPYQSLFIPGQEPTQPLTRNTSILRQPALALVITLALTGSLFFSVPQGMSAWFSAIPVYLRGWIDPVSVPALRLVVALMVYETLPVLFALVASADALRNRFASGTIEQRLIYWLVPASLVVLLYPGRQTNDLVWVLVPLWGLAAIALARLFGEQPGLVYRHPATTGQAVLIVLLGILFWYSLSAINYTVVTGGSLWLRLAILAGILALGALSTGLISLGWSWEVGRTGLSLGLLVVLGVIQVSFLVSASQLHTHSGQDLWTPAPVIGQADLLVGTLSQLSEWQTGDPRAAEVVVTSNSPALRWVLRHFTQTRFTQGASPGSLPPIVITPADQDAPELAASYRGQDFVWQISPGWDGAIPANFGRWITARESPVIEQQVILWARTDVFPGGDE